MSDTDSENAPLMPALFIGHGSPMNLVLDNSYTRALKSLRGRLPAPAAILVISAHWLTRDTHITCSERMRQIHDFYGFPERLYDIKYEPPAAAELARSIRKAVQSTSMHADTSWGLDHGAWAVLYHLYPEASVPTIQISIDMTMQPGAHMALARELAMLRRKNVLLIGSGNIVHNLRLADFDDIDARPFDWAVEFDCLVRDAVEKRDDSALRHYDRFGKSAALAVPTSDHYLPLLHIAAIRDPDESVSWIHEGFQNRSISMRCMLLPGRR
jgi:4,5-DOPA dioxygenase extradiol